MQERYYIHKVDLKGLVSQDFEHLLQTKKMQGEKVCIVMELDNTFDEWDIEKYVEAFERLSPDQIQITVNRDIFSKPTLRQIVEVEGALSHFANFDRYDEKAKCQYFTAGQMEILFWNEPA